MEYNDFTLESAEATLGVMTHTGDLFPGIQPALVPTWLDQLLQRSRGLALMNGKARSEFLVAPILLAVREASGDSVAILSGQRLDIDSGRHLHGECDFLLTSSAPVPRVRAPIVAVVESMRNDIDGGLGKCVAQMVAAQMYNERAGQPRPTIYGSVTTGENWQFLGLTGTAVVLHRPRLYLAEVGLILAAFGRAVGGVTVPA